MYDALFAESITITGHGGDSIEAYSARPLDSAPRGGVVVIHHMPGYDIQTKEIARNFADHGYNAVVPNLYWREAPGASADDAAATARAQGGVPDDRLVGDVAGAAAYLKSLTNSDGKFVTGEAREGTTMVPIVDKTPTLSCPLLGLFGNDDQYPSPAQVDELEEALKANGKTYEFHRYDGAGHAFFAVNRPSYRPEAANDGWEKIFAFYGKYL
jgi:carboxymethylenebutenolidase